MASKLHLSGFRELRHDLAALPDTARDASAPALLAMARKAQAEIMTAYPVVTGTLRAGVKIVNRVPRGVAAFYTLVTTAPYAHLVEFGTARRRPRAIFLPISMAARRASVIAVGAAVERLGLVVRGQRD